MKDITYNVRVYKTEVYKGKRVTTYYVRWNTDGKTWKEPYRNAAQADVFRSELVTAARRGEAFSMTTGRPTSWKRQESLLSWYAFTLAFADAKWPHASPNHRRGIAEALVDATEALLSTETGIPSRETRRTALRWAYSTRIRDDKKPPADLEKALRWLDENTVCVQDFNEQGKGAVLARAVLTRISQTLDGKTAAANTANRKRMVLNNAMEYGQEIGLLTGNPFKAVK